MGSPRAQSASADPAGVTPTPPSATKTRTLLLLHGGWGAQFYPWDGVIDALPDYDVLLPVRPIRPLPLDFHAIAAREMEALVAGREDVALWGHSDGAVIAAIMATRRPYRAVILEALHVDRVKPGSRAFFEMMANDPDGFGPKVCARLEAEHGDRWREMMRIGGNAWLAIAATPDQDFYDHRLGDIASPTLILHGVDDPRTEPGELERVRREVAHVRFAMIEGGGHAPHRKPEGVAAGVKFLRELE